MRSLPSLHAAPISFLILLIMLSKKWNLMFRFERWQSQFYSNFSFVEYSRWLFRHVFQCHKLSQFFFFPDMIFFVQKIEIQDANFINCSLNNWQRSSKCCTMQPFELLSFQVRRQAVFLSIKKKRLYESSLVELIFKDMVSMKSYKRKKQVVQKKFCLYFLKLPLNRKFNFKVNKLSENNFRRDSLIQFIFSCQILVDLITANIRILLSCLNK